MNSKNDYKYFDTACEIGKRLAESGAEAYRVENTVEIILKTFGAHDISVFSIPTLLLIFAKHEKKRLFFSVRIHKTDIDLAEIERMNELSRRMCKSKSFPEISDSDYSYSKVFRLFCAALSTGAFCIYFGGTPLDAVLCSVPALAISLFENNKPFSLGEIAFSFRASLIAGLIACFFEMIIPGCSSNKIMIGAIMLLIPGLSIGNSIRDLLFGDILSGTLSLINAVTGGVSIVGGFAFAIAFFKYAVN